MNITKMLEELDEFKKNNPNATEEEISKELDRIQESRIDELRDMYKQSWFEDIKDFFKEFKYNIGYYSIKNGLQNFWLYRKIIWEDRWFDYSYFDKLVKFKLQTMVDNWDKSHYVCSDKDKNNMAEVILLFNDIEKYEDDFSDDSDDKVNETYEKIGRLIYGISERDFICKDDGEEHHIKDRTANLRRWWD
jgi:hypothetical protein